MLAREAVDFCKDRQHPRAPEPVAGIIEIAFAAVHHPVPVGAKVTRRILKNAVRFIDRVQHVEQGPAHQRKVRRIGNRLPTAHCRIVGVSHSTEEFAVERLGRDQLSQQVIVDE
jgi:hypothetical protein